MKHSKPIASHTLPGMASAVVEQSEAQAAYSAETLTARLIEDRPSIDTKAGEMERNSPLFRGTGSNPTLF